MAVQTNAQERPVFDPTIDYYAVLQVHPTAHVEVIKRAYRTILTVLGAHPDLGGDHAYAVQVNDAYRVLSHPATRHAYDAARRRVTLRSILAARGGQEHHRLVRCRRCGARNRLPLMTDLQHAICGRCRALLGQ